MDTVTLLATAVVLAAAVAAVVLSEYVLALPLKLIASYGWRELAELYPDRRGNVDRHHYFRTVGINAMRYRSCVVISTGDGFVNLSCMFPFRFFHPPISLPVADLRSSSTSVKAYGLTEFAVRGTTNSIGLPARFASEVLADQSRREGVDGFE